MALIGLNTNVTVKLGGVEIALPSELLDSFVDASFENGNLQGSIAIEELTFKGLPYSIIKEHIANGLINGVGIYEGISFTIEAYNKNEGRAVFDGFVDLSDGIEIDDIRGEIRATIKERDGLNVLSDRLASINYQSLYNEGIITDSDFVSLEYTVITPTNFVESVLMKITFFIMVRETIVAIRETSKQIAIVAGISGSSPSGTIGAAILAGLYAALLAAYAFALIVQVVSLGRNIFEAYAPSTRSHKLSSLRKLLEKAAEKLGYGFESNISFLDNVHYLASNQNVDTSLASAFLATPQTVTKGIPNVNDYGYSCEEIYALCFSGFNARFILENDIIKMYTELSPFWDRQAAYTMPDVLEPSYSYNTNELKSRIAISFQTDLADVYTIQDKTGRAYEVVTEPKTVQQDDFVGVKGVEQIQIPLALGSRKNELTPFERLITDIANIIDDVTGILGGGTNFRGQLNFKTGQLKVSDNNHSIPKLIWLEGGRIPSDHRSKFSAKTLWENYLFEKSFVLNAGRRQRKLFTNNKVPFGFVSFLRVAKNAYIYDIQGNRFKVDSLQWEFLKDYALISGYIEERYTDNLKETYIEL